MEIGEAGTRQCGGLFWPTGGAIAAAMLKAECDGALHKRSEAWPSVPGNIFVRNDQIACIQFSDLLALARHSRPAPAANFIMPGAARVICAHPPDIETNGTVPGHRLTRQDGWRRFFRNVFHLFLFNLTFSLVVELVVLAVGLSVFLPELVRAANDFNLLGSHLLSIP